MIYNSLAHWYDMLVKDEAATFQTCKKNLLTNKYSNTPEPAVHTIFIPTLMRSFPVLLSSIVIEIKNNKQITITTPIYA